MLNLNINLTSLALILWSGMLVIAGSIWVLSSQVRKLADLLEDRPKERAAAAEAVCEVRLTTTASPARVARRGAPVRVRGGGRIAVSGSRALPQLVPPRRRDANTGRLTVGDDSSTS